MLHCNTCQLVVLLGTLLPLPSLGTPPVVAHGPTGAHTLPAPGRPIRGRFLQYSQRNSSLPPPSFSLCEKSAGVSKLDGKARSVRYFERPVFNWRPQTQSPHDVLHSQLTTLRLGAPYPPGPPAGSPLPTVNTCGSHNTQLGTSEVLTGLDWRTVPNKLYRLQGGYAAAQPLLEESLAIRREVGNKYSIAYSLAGFAGQAGAQKEPASAKRAARLLGATQALRQATGVHLENVYLKEFDRTLAESREQLGEAAFAIAWNEGRGMSMEQVIAYALEP